MGVMKLSFLRTTSLVVCGSLSLICASFAQDADNTKKNERDKAGDTKTPIDQSNTKEDLNLVKTIRANVMKDKSLTALAKNAKIITTGGAVYLRGPVKSEEEKKQLEAIATAAAGEGKVTNQLEVKAGQ
jgi:hyperosmotically inducible periplasmic protein